MTDAPRLRELTTLAIETPADYDRLKDRIRVVVATAAPPGRTLVVSKGDDELLALHDRRGEHFPQDHLGRFPSAHPADSTEAIAQLEALVERGARQLVVPATSFWWFAHYEELTAELEARAELVALEPDACAVFALWAPAVEPAPAVAAPAPPPPVPQVAARAPDRRGRVLFFCHNHPAGRPAGAENYALELHRALVQDGPYDPVFVARADGEGVRPFEDRPGEYLLGTDIGEWDVLLGTMRDKRLYTQVVRALLDEVKPDVVHVQHTYLIGYDVLREVRNALPSVPIVATLHELLPICHNRGQMVRTWGTELCTHASPARCHACFPGTPPAQFFLRTQFIRSALELVDRFVCPSRFLAQRFVEWGLPAERVLVEDYGRAEVTPAVSAPEREPPVCIGFFGQLSPFKGVDVLLEAALELQRAGSPARFVVHGSHLELQSDAFRARFAELLDAAAPTVRFHGAYRPEDLDALMAEVDWVVVPSIWWENSPLVIQEAFQRGRPVICADIGGMAEKVTHDINGLHFRAGSASDLAATIARAVSEPGLWPRLHAGVPPVHPMARHVEWLTALYDALRAEKAAMEPAHA